MLPGALLTGLNFDDRGNRMSPSFSVKRGVRYPFYVSSALLRGRRSQAGSVARVSASAIEATVLRAVRQHMHLDDDTAHAPNDLIEQNVARVAVEAQRVVIALNSSGKKTPTPIEIPWSARNKRDLVQINGDHAGNPHKPNPQLVQAIVRAHAWLKLLSDGTHDSIESLAGAVDLHPKVIRKGIRLAFLAPTLTKAVLHGEQRAALILGDRDQTVALGWNEQQSHLRSSV